MNSDHLVDCDEAWDIGRVNSETVEGILRHLKLTFSTLPLGDNQVGDAVWVKIVESS